MPEKGNSNWGLFEAMVSTDPSNQDLTKSFQNAIDPGGQNLTAVIYRDGRNNLGFRVLAKVRPWAQLLLENGLLEGEKPDPDLR